MDKPELFLCPVCGLCLDKKINNSYYCANNHCYDRAKSGYLNLLPVNKKNSVSPGDNKEMISARVSVMNKGYYSVLADTVIDKLKVIRVDRILDAGCGTGYIAGRLKSAFKDSEVIGTDISKFAIEQASKKYKDVAFAVASSYRLPIEDKSCDCVICAFAPVYAREFARISKDGGYFLRIVPGEKHLIKLKEFLYEVPRLNEDEPTETEGFEFLEKKFAESEIFFNADELCDLVKMTPYYYHTPQSALNRLKESVGMNVNTQFEIRIYRKSLTH